jgi:hypothetical protein
LHFCYFSDRVLSFCLELALNSDPPNLYLPVAGITGMSHWAWLKFRLLYPFKTQQEKLAFDISFHHMHSSRLSSALHPHSTPHGFRRSVPHSPNYGKFAPVSIL